MNKTKWIKTGCLLAAASSMLLTGCVYRERTVYSNPPPPGPAPAPGPDVEVSGPPPGPPPGETETDVAIGVAPGPDFVWIGGFWAWGPHGWYWTRGYWGHPPHPGMRWVHPHYVYRGGRHVWVRGGWR